MQSLYLLCRSSSDSGGGIFLPSRKLASFVGMWAHAYGRSRRSADRTGPVTASGAVNGGGEQNHYAVLGIPRTATNADVKRAYRLLARKYHPDVSQDLQAGEIFKNIHLAYEVLSDEAARARYDMALNFPVAKGSSWRRKWAHDPDYDKRRIYRWAELKQRMYERKNREEETSWYYQTNSYQETSGYERGSFSEVLRFACFTLFFMQMVGHRLSLALCGVAAVLDQQLDAGYKMGYLIAWLLGGQGGVLLALCIYFVSWLCGKKSSSLVALVVVAMWVGANVARFTPLPQGAVLTLLYMSIKLQVDMK